MNRIFCATALSVLSSAATAAPLPDPIRAMIDAALATKEPQTIAAVVSVAKRTVPDNAADIDAIVADYSRSVAAEQAAREQAARERLASASLFSLWKGELEVGGSWSSGNTSSLGLYGAAKAKREGLRWQHDFSARVDYQRTGDDPTTERAVVAYQPRYKINPSFYTYGLGQYEHDRTLGYRNRFTSGLGVGVVAVNRPDLNVEFDLGPALRYTQYYDMGDEQRVAGRGAFKFRWQPWPTLTIAQDLAVYVQKGNTTAASSTSIETRLFGPVKSKLSFNVQYESDAPDGQKHVDTVSHASLVYSF